MKTSISSFKFEKVTKPLSLINFHQNKNKFLGCFANLEKKTSLLDIQHSIVSSFQTVDVNVINDEDVDVEKFEKFLDEKFLDDKDKNTNFSRENWMRLKVYFSFWVIQKLSNDDWQSEGSLVVEKIISSKDEFNKFKSSFSEFCFFESEKGNIKEILYRLFILLTRVKSSRNDLIIDVFNWLLEEKKIKEIIKEKNSNENFVIETFVSFNDSLSTKWAFSKYYNDEEIKKIFSYQDENGEGIFDYAIKGISWAEGSSSETDLDIISILFREFRKIIKNNREKDQLEKECFEKIKRLLEEDGQFDDLEEEFIEQLCYPDRKYWIT